MRPAQPEDQQPNRTDGAAGEAEYHSVGYMPYVSLNFKKKSRRSPFFSLKRGEEGTYTGIFRASLNILSILSVFSASFWRLGNEVGRTRKPARMIQWKMQDRMLYMNGTDSNTIAVNFVFAIVLRLAVVVLVAKVLKVAVLGLAGLSGARSTSGLSCTELMVVASGAAEIGATA